MFHRKNNLILKEWWLCILVDNIHQLNIYTQKHSNKNPLPVTSSVCKYADTVIQTTNKRKVKYLNPLLIYLSSHSLVTTTCKIKFTAMRKLGATLSYPIMFLFYLLWWVKLNSCYNYHQLQFIIQFHCVSTLMRLQKVAPDVESLSFVSGNFLMQLDSKRSLEWPFKIILRIFIG